ncbi:multidrug effflux MFS transporter [Terrarubrum flagellatum]|uniref:multidrug effflux MFS transporter n=1 Tax=Terrirubrum flagellatum TaxID=2895980 RepID=UPI0031455F2B
MQLRAGTLALTATLAFLTSLLPLSTDMYLPSLPAIARAFEVAPADAQATLSMFLLGMVGGQVFYGPLSDSLGRRPALLAGMVLFTVASLLCAFSQSIGLLIAARFLQALGAAAPVVIGRAIVRDLYDGSQAGRELSRMGAFMGLIPALGPMLGGVTQQYLGWRAIFIIAAVLSTALGLFVWRALPETSRIGVKVWPGFGSILREYGIVLRSPVYRAYVGILVASHAGLFAFISTATFILQGRYGLTPVQFGLGFGTAGFGYVAGAFTAQRIVTKLGLDGTIRLGVLAQLAAGAAALTLMLAQFGSSLTVILPAALFTFGHGLVQPQTQAGSALPHPDRAGAAASLAGIFQLGFASLYGFILASGLSYTPLVLPCGLALAGIASTTIFFATRSIRARK